MQDKNKTLLLSAIKGSTTIDLPQKKEILDRFESLSEFQVAMLLQVFRKDERVVWNMVVKDKQLRYELISKAKSDWSMLAEEYNLPDLPYPEWFTSILINSAK